MTRDVKANKKNLKQELRVLNQPLPQTCKRVPTELRMMTPTWVKASTRLAFPSPRYFHFLCLRLNLRGVRQSGPEESNIAAVVLHKKRQLTQAAVLYTTRYNSTANISGRIFCVPLSHVGVSSSVTQLSDWNISFREVKHPSSCTARLRVAKHGETFAQLVTHKPYEEKVA